MNILITGETKVRGPYPLNISYDRIINGILGNEAQISRVENLPECARLISDGKVDGVIIPFGHGDRNALINLKLNLAYINGLVRPSIEDIHSTDVPVPVFEDYHFVSGLGTSSHYIQQMNLKYATSKRNALEGWLEQEVGNLAKK